MQNSANSKLPKRKVKLLSEAAGVYVLTLPEEGTKEGRKGGPRSPNSSEMAGQAWQAKTSCKPPNPRLGGKQDGNKGHTPSFSRRREDDCVQSTESAARSL
uniref:Uncharacterized protein n=1 Tax=Micrurus corallinus TaxID=54390 RepID=A0A2D4EJ53_MICCO